MALRPGAIPSATVNWIGVSEQVQETVRWLPYAGEKVDAFPERSRAASSQRHSRYTTTRRLLEVILDHTYPRSLDSDPRLGTIRLQDQETQHEWC